MTTRALCAAAFGLLVSVTCVQAETDAEIAAGWGLLGEWRNSDCAAPASPQIQSMKFVVKGGKLYLDRDFGARADSNRVTSVEPTLGGGIMVTVALEVAHETREIVFLKPEPKRLQTLANRSAATGEFTIRDGKIVNGGQPAPLLYRCD